MARMIGRPGTARVGLPADQFGGEKAHEPHSSLGVVEADDRSAVGQPGDRREQPRHRGHRRRSSAARVRRRR